MSGVDGSSQSGEYGRQAVDVNVTPLRDALAGTRFADVRWVAETGSTNADVLALTRDGAPEGVVLVADHQTAGRGRRDRAWLAPPGGSLLVSVLLRPLATVAPAATMAVAVAMAEAVEQVGGVSPGLKWPNDLVVEDLKLAGILAEADWPAGSTISAGWRAPARHERIALVVGVGLNVTWPPLDPGSVAAGQPVRPPEGRTATTDAPSRRPDGWLGGSEDAPTGTSGRLGSPSDELAQVSETATALNWLGVGVDRAELLVAFLRRLDARYGELVRSGSPAATLGEWRRRSATLGRRVRVDLGADDVEGTAVDVTEEGHLVVDTLEGRRRTLAVGDIVHLRPA